MRIGNLCVLMKDLPFFEFRMADLVGWKTAESEVIERNTWHLQPAGSTSVSGMAKREGSQRGSNRPYLLH